MRGRGRSARPSHLTRLVIGQAYPSASRLGRSSSDWLIGAQWAWSPGVGAEGRARSREAGLPRRRRGRARGWGSGPGGSMTNGRGPAGGRPGRRPRGGRGGLQSGVRAARGRGGAGRVPGETAARQDPLGAVWGAGRGSGVRRPALGGLLPPRSPRRAAAGGGRRGTRGRAGPRRTPAGRLPRLGRRRWGRRPSSAFRRSFPSSQMASAPTSWLWGLRPEDGPLPQSRGCRRGRGRS